MLKPRVGLLAWNNHVLTTGGVDGKIVNYDTRSRMHNIVQTYRGHRQEVHGLKYSDSGKQLASEENDNMIYIWDQSMASPTWWLHQLKSHTAAVKGLGLYPSMVKQAELSGNTSRALNMAQSSDGYTVAPAAAGDDEMLKFWNSFGSPKAPSMPTPRYNLGKFNLIEAVSKEEKRLTKIVNDLPATFQFFSCFKSLDQNGILLELRLAAPTSDAESFMPPGSDFAILSRNFYWLHLQGGDYKLLETYRTKKIPLKMKSNVFIGWSVYQIQMHIENLSNTTNFKALSCKNHVIDRHDNDYDMGTIEPVEIPLKKLHNYGLLQRIYRWFLTGGDGVNFVETNETDSGVAFFLYFSVHATKKDKQEGDDTRILKCIILRKSAICKN
ncbi:hypothetical protein GIB67_032521 [Kingdonia uniflora]|uniref:Uncharacterized protein n=1 Tax=Kingdonia uniflora TaxID=39325 RepID=A0A7J7L7M3_9MAGN|nr:hypothetical protein GIB67_032521 [Kingdonia uniflora]